MRTNHRSQWGTDHRRAWPDHAIAGLAARQRTIVRRQQLLELGVVPRTINAALARGRLHHVHVGIYSLVPAAARPGGAAEQAALLACGPRAVLSHNTAGTWHGVRIRGISDVELTVAGVDRGRSRSGIAVHRTALLHPDDLVVVGGLPVTSLPRTVIDLAPELTDRALEHLVDEALKRVGRRRLYEAVTRHAARRGVARVRLGLDPDRPSSDTWSVAEERLLRAIRRAGLPAPEANVAIGGYVPDLLWREQRVIVEFESFAHHSGPSAFGRGWARHNDLTAQGYEVIHVTWQDLDARRERVLVWIATALVRAGWTPG